MHTCFRASVKISLYFAYVRVLFMCLIVSLHIASQALGISRHQCRSGEASVPRSGQRWRDRQAAPKGTPDGMTRDDIDADLYRRKR
jgi:hypothetical protein